MKLSGSYKFHAPSAQVFQAILNPNVLKAAIPGCDSVTYIDPSNLKVEITTQLPGLKGTYTFTINITRRQDPNFLELQVVRQGRGGSINAISQITLTDEADGALLAYSGNADLGGAIAIADNPIGQGAVKGGLGNFFKNLEKSL